MAASVKYSLAGICIPFQVEQYEHAVLSVLTCVHITCSLPVFPIRVLMYSADLMPAIPACVVLLRMWGWKSCHAYFRDFLKSVGGFESHSKELLTWCNKYIWTVYALFVLLGCISCCVLLLSSSWSVCVHQDCTSIYCSQKQSGTKLLHTSAFEVAVI